MDGINLFGGQVTNPSYPTPMVQQQVPAGFPYWNNNMAPQMTQQTVMNNPAQARRVSSGFSGKIINNFNEIMPEEVPSNGAPAIFPLSDGSGILVKALDGNYKVQNQFYVKQEITAEACSEDQPTETQMILQRLDKIESLLSAQLSPVHFEQQNSKSGGKWDNNSNKKEESKDAHN